MLKFERFFRIGVIILFAVNVLSTLTSMSLIERMIPTHDEQLNLIRAQEKALRSLLAARMEPAAFSNSPGKEVLEGVLLLLEDSKSWDREQRDYLADLRKEILAPNNGTVLTTEDFVKLWKVIYDLQRAREEKKVESFRNAGLAGSWVVGLTSIVSLLALFIFQARVKRLIVFPSAELVRGLNDWWLGNRMRRLRCPQSATEIYESMQILNDILDEK